MRKPLLITLFTILTFSCNKDNTSPKKPIETSLAKLTSITRHCGSSLNPPGAVSTFTYNEDGTLAHKKDSNTINYLTGMEYSIIESTYEYDINKQLIKRNDKRRGKSLNGSIGEGKFETTTYEYKNGLLQKVTKPSGQYSTYQYLGNLLREKADFTMDKLAISVTKYKYSKSLLVEEEIYDNILKYSSFIIHEYTPNKLLARSFTKNAAGEKHQIIAYVYEGDQLIKTINTKPVFGPSNDCIFNYTEMYHYQILN